MQFPVSGTWTPADPSKNRLEIAPTEQPGVFALRDTYEPQTVIPVTATQLQKFAQAATGGPLRSVIERGGDSSAGSGSGSTGSSSGR